jgi:hypothetical protein
MYQNKRVLLASMHKKEQAIAPAFAQHLGCTVCVEAFDTDQFGTFTGEVERELSAYETCVLKAKRAAQVHDYALSIASEGSFGPHPANPFLPSAHEIMVFVDREHEWVIAEQYTTTETNYQSLVIDAHTDIEPFLKAVQFPTHALTLHTHPDRAMLAKGIGTRTQLDELVKQHLQTVPKLSLGTDMRAMLNPTRMQVLAQLAQRLALRIATPCTACATPGFGPTATTGYLPCESCGGETGRHAFDIWSCIQCEQQTTKPRADGLVVSEATYCQWCNP